MSVKAQRPEPETGDAHTDERSAGWTSACEGRISRPSAFEQENNIYLYIQEKMRKTVSTDSIHTVQFDAYNVLLLFFFLKYSSKNVVMVNFTNTMTFK